MARPRKDPLRPLTGQERQSLEQLGRDGRQPADQRAWAKALLAVAAGQTYPASARAAGLKTYGAVARAVARFNRQGLDAFAPRHPPAPYRRKDPLRPLTARERDILVAVSRDLARPASHVARAKALLAVAAGQSYPAAAHAAGRRSDDAVAHLVARFNREGLAAIVPRVRGWERRPVHRSESILGICNF